MKKAAVINELILNEISSLEAKTKVFEKAHQDLQKVLKASPYNTKEILENAGIGKDYYYKRRKNNLTLNDINKIIKVLTEKLQSHETKESNTH